MMSFQSKTQGRRKLQNFGGTSAEAFCDFCPESKPYFNDSGRLRGASGPPGPPVPVALRLNWKKMVKTSRLWWWTFFGCDWVWQNHLHSVLLISKWNWLKKLISNMTDHYNRPTSLLELDIWHKIFGYCKFGPKKFGR